MWTTRSSSGHMKLSYCNATGSIRTLIRDVTWEGGGKLPILDILIRRRPYGRLGCSVSRKPTHTDSFHHPAHKRAVLSTLAHRERMITEKDHLPAEINHLRRTLLKDGYTAAEISRSLHGSGRKQDAQSKGKRANIPYAGKSSARISRILAKHGIKSVPNTAENKGDAKECKWWGRLEDSRNIWYTTRMWS